MTAPPTPAAAGTGLSWPHCPSPQVFLRAWPGPVSLWPITPPKGARGAGRTLAAGSGCQGSWALAASTWAPPALASPGAPAPPPSPRLGPPWWRGASGPLLAGSGLHLGVGRAGGEAAPAAAPPTGRSAALPWQVSLPSACRQPVVGMCPLTFQLPEPLPPAPLALSVCQSPSSASRQLDERMPAAQRAFLQPHCSLWVLVDLPLHGGCLLP